MNTEKRTALRKIVFLFLFIASLPSCIDTNLDIQNNPNHITEENADVQYLFNAIQISFSKAVWSAYDETMPIVRMTAMFEGATYDSNDKPQNFDLLWGNAYAECFPDIDAGLKLLEDLEGVEFSIGMAKALKAYLLLTLVDIFGDIPFENSIIENEFSVNPDIKDDEVVYSSALNLLKEAKVNFKKAIEINEKPIHVDLFFNGDSHQWLKAVNSLMIRYYVSTRLANDFSSELIQLLSEEEFISDWNDDFDFQYSSIDQNVNSAHPSYLGDYEVSQNGGQFQSNYFMHSLIKGKPIPDPRLRYYFIRQHCELGSIDSFCFYCGSTPRPPHYDADQPYCAADWTQGYLGRDHGSDSFALCMYFHATFFGVFPTGGEFDRDQCERIPDNRFIGLKGAGILPIVSAASIDFLRAEAALTMNTGEDPRALLESGIYNSIEKVMNFGKELATPEFTPSAANIDEYLTAVLINYDNASSDLERLNVIMKEYHIAAFGNGLDAYNNYRRTGMPWNMQPTLQLDSGTFPRLFYYPSNHVNLNANAQQRNLNQQVFWDNNPANPNWVN